VRSLRALLYYAYSLVEMVIHFKNWPKVLSLLIHQPGWGLMTLRIRRPKMDVFVRGAMDIWSVKETILDQFYTRYGTPVQADWTVVDVGAGIGDYCLHATNGVDGVKVVAFEPYPGSYDLLQRNLALNGIEQVRTYQKAVWGSSGKLHLNLSTGEPLQIQSQENPGFQTGEDVLIVDAVSLEAVLTTEKLDMVDLLKMDCEGAEYEIFLYAPEDILGRIKRIIMEYHDIDAEHHHQVLVSFLQNQGYRVTCHQNFVHQHIGYLYAVRG
jgi:FkbM family methyltransferase